MATDATMEWDSLPEEDQIKQQEEITKFLQERSTVEDFIANCENIGQVAVDIDDDFRTVKNGFTNIVRKYGQLFPDVDKEYVPRWDGFMARWNGDNGILWSSRKLAAETAAALSDYGVNLGLIADIKTEEDWKDAQAELNDYIQRHPIESATQVADGFKNLRNDISVFSDDFTNYMKEQKQTLTEDAEKYEAEIEQCQKKIAELNTNITITSVSLGVAPFFGLLALVPTFLLSGYVRERDEMQARLKQAQRNLARTVEQQKALPAMQADFERLKPNIANICENLGMFANIWAFAAEQSIELNVALSTGIQAVSRKKFQATLQLLMAEIEPLKEGMRKYASQIHRPGALADVNEA